MACNSKQSEIPHWNLSEVTDGAKKAWNDEVLSTITTSDLSNQTRLEMFYTGLYHTSLMPTDKTGQNRIGKWSHPDSYTG